MSSDWLIFCDHVFSLSALWWRRIRGLWKLPDGRDWLRGKLGLVLMGGAMASKFSVDGQGCVPSLLFDLRQNYGGDNEDNGDLQMVLCIHCSHSMPLTLHQATAAPRLCCRFLDTHRQVWVSLLWGHCSFILGPGSVCALQESISQSCVSFESSMVGLTATSSKRA